MAIIRIDGFTGLAPKIDPKKLPDGGAQYADGCVFEAGDVRPLRMPVTASWGASPTPAYARTIHPWKDRWLAWQADASVVNSPVVADQWERIYWSDGIGRPKYAINNTLNAHVQMDAQGVPLGIDRPTSKPVAILGAALEPEATVQSLSQTTPVRVVTMGAHPFDDGQRVIVVFEGQSPPDRTGMVEIVGKTYTVKLVRTNGVAASNQLDLIGADGANFSAYAGHPAKVKRVYGESDKESRSYVYTFVSQYGEESQPSDPSDVVDVLRDAALTVRGFSITPAHINQGYRVRLYRSVTGNSGTAFFFVKELPAVTAQNGIIDDVQPERIGEMLPSETWAPPPVGLDGMVVMPGGFLAGFKGNTLYFSEPYMPHAWPAAYTRTTQDAIVGLGVFGQTLVVATRGKPYLASGADPASVSLQQLDDHAPCMSRRCLTATGTGVIYPTLDGLVHVSMAGVRRLTQSRFTQKQWQTFFQNGKCAIWHDGKYIASAGGGIVIFAPHDKGLHVSTFMHGDGYNPDAFAIAPVVMRGNQQFQRDTLFFAQGPWLYAFDRGQRTHFDWYGKITALPRPVSMACAQVFASDYPVILRIYAGVIPPGSSEPVQLDAPWRTAPVFEAPVEGPEPFRLPGGFMAREWCIGISSPHDVQFVAVATSMDEIKQV